MTLRETRSRVKEQKARAPLPENQKKRTIIRQIAASADGRNNWFQSRALRSQTTISPMLVERPGRKQRKKNNEDQRKKFSSRKFG
jgi:hypothetical protein